MSSALAIGKRSLTWTVVVTTIAWAMGLSLLVTPFAARAVAAGSLIKGSLPAVYYYAADEKRYVFPNEKTYKTWYSDFSGVQTVTDSELAAIAIGGNATYRPGVKMVKITTDPKVYAIAAGGTLRHIASEEIASALYGASWATMVEDVPDAFFVNYTIGSAVEDTSSYNKTNETAAATSIGVDKGIAGAVADTTPPPPVAAVLSAMDGGSPGNATIPHNATDVIFAKVKFTGSGTIDSVKVTRGGLSRDVDLTGVKVFDGTTQLGTTQTLNAAHQAVFTGLGVAVSGEKVLTIAGDISNVNAGDIVQLGVESASDVTLASGSVSGSFPIRGGEMTLSSVTIGTSVLYRGADMPTSDTNVNPDEVDYRFTQVRIEAGSVEDVTVRQIVAIQSGTASASDVKDIKLVNDDTDEVLKTVVTMPANGRVVFDGLNVVVAKGEDVNLSVKASLSGGSSSGRTVGFDFHDGVAYTVRIVGNTFGFGITPTRNNFCATTGVTGGVCQTQTVSQGTLRLARATSSPATGNIPQGGTSVPLLAVDYTVTGEEVRITSQTFGLAFANLACSELTSVSLYQGNSIVAGPKDCAGTIVNFTDTVTVPVGTTTYTLKGNIAQATSGGDTVAVALCLNSAAAANGCATTDTMTARGVNSGKVTTVSTTANVTGNTLTVQAGALSSVTDATPILGNVVAGVQDFGFANLTLDSSSGGEDVKVTSLVVVDTTGAAGDPDDLINWELWGDPDTSDADNTVKRIETTNATASATSATGAVGEVGTVTFTLRSPIRVARAKSVKLQVRADVLASAATGATATHTVDLSTITASGWTTGATVGSTPAGAGQAQAVVASGVLKVELAADRAVSGPIVAGSTGVSMVKYKFTASDEDVDVTEIPLFLADGTTGVGTLPNVSNVKLFLDGAPIGNLAGYSFDNNGERTAVLSTGVFRAVKDTPTYLEIKADFNAKEQASSGTQARVGIADDAGADGSDWGAAAANTIGYGLVAKGKDSGATVDTNDIDSSGADGNTTGTINGGYAMGVFDGVLTVGLDANSPSGVHTAGTGKEVFRFWLTATGDEITVHDLAIAVSGSASDAATDGSGAIGATATGNATLSSPDKSVTYATWVTGDTVSTEPLDPTGGALHVSTDVNTTNDAGWDTQIVVGAGQTKVVSLIGDTTGAGGANTSKSLQYRIDTYSGVVASGVMWYDTELSNKGSANCPAAATYDNGADNTDDSTTNNTVRSGEDRCVVDSGTYTKTLPVNGNGLTYN